MVNVGFSVASFSGRYQTDLKKIEKKDFKIVLYTVDFFYDKPFNLVYHLATPLE